MSRTAEIINGLVEVLSLSPRTMSSGHGYSKWEEERSKVIAQLLKELEASR